MKKILFGICLMILVSPAPAQFFRGIGIFVGGNSSMHRYINTDADQKVDSIFVPAYYYPQNHYSREYISWDAGIFLEMLNRDGIRWQTEFEYTKKGANEMEITDQYLGTRSGSYSTNKYTYLQWNNYLKMFFLPNVYLMPGVKAEYNLNKSTSVFTAISSNVKKIWFNPVVGVGKEFDLRGQFKPIVEFFWNPDIFYKIDNVRFRNRTFELRVGVIYRKKRRSIDDCNAPKYHGNYY